MLTLILAAAAISTRPVQTVHEPLPTPAPLPIIVVDRDNVEISTSCRVQIPEGLVIADTDNNGVIHIVGDDIELDFTGSTLRGAVPATPPDELTGTGIMIDAWRGVILQNLTVQGYKVAVYASAADALEIDGALLTDNYRQHLGSTPAREDSSDWLSPHHNDNNEWVNNYGAAIYVEDSEDILIRGVTVRRGQNGILLDHVRQSQIYDNDASFLSGWGLGLWRSTENTITRNHFDFCVRGHVEGVYNRGQDSAGILMFEQSSNNIIAENSITHGGDGIFGFGGLDALGQTLRDEQRQALREQTGDDDVDWRISWTDEQTKAHERKGCNNNIFAHNDLSYAPAHGLEMTFSFGNVIYQNRFAEDAICGIWGGFSQNTLIMENLFEADGGMAYGLERGGVNIEHGASNIIIANRFLNDRAGVHLWWDDLGDFKTLPWATANYRGVINNVIADNSFVLNEVPESFHKMSATERMVAIQLRNESGSFDSVAIVNNSYDIDESIGERLRTTGDTPINDRGPIPGIAIPEYKVLGNSRPVKIVDGVPTSTRENLGGRDAIIIDEWGPWDHESPLLRPITTSGGAVAIYELLGVDAASATSEGDGYSVTVIKGPLPRSARISIEAEAGVAPYSVDIKAENFEQQVTGTLIKARWLCRAFSWKDGPDPRKDFDAWRKLARGPGSRPFGTRALSLPFAFAGPNALAQDGTIEDTSGQLKDTPIGSDHFGVEAIGRLRMPAGRWKIRTLSDDGIRVSVVTSTDQNRTIIDNWTWHGPASDVGSFTVATDNEIVLIRVFYFEIDGYSTLELSLEREP
jgi:copper-binding protein NosD